MKPMSSGTFSITSGAQRATWKNPSFRLRLAGFALAVATVALLIVGIDSNIWRAQSRLEEGFAAIKAEKFYFGVNFRVMLRTVNDSLLDYRLTGDPAELREFRRQALDLNTWIESKQGSFVTQAERSAFTHLKAAYRDFLTRIEPLTRVNTSTPLGPEGFAATYAHEKQDYEPVLKACEDVLRAEHDGFEIFLQTSDRALLSLQRLFLLSLLLLVLLAATLALLVYRGMIAPLQAQLSESQALIARQEKLASLGALGAAVAHEIRNPLTAIKFRLFSLKKSLPPGFADNEDARTISEEINRLDRIVKDFLQFARPSDPELVRIPVERILREVQGLMKSELDQAAINLKIEAPVSVWVFADSYQLKQVLINLIQNAADSIGRNGVITLGLKAATAAFAEKNGPAAILSVADTGKGIPVEVQKRLFDPFFTTKDGGTGLGLAIAARVVEKHGGLLRYRTELNRGTTFEIVLPGTGDDATKNTAHRG
jgi:signal transduction histidine kinase